MDITKSSIWGSVALVVLVAALLSFRAHYLAEREECGRRLTRLVPVLEVYARQHQGVLPTADELAHALGHPLPTSTVFIPPARPDDKMAHLRYRLRHKEMNGLPYHMAAHPPHWKTGKAQPYLWDACPHEYVNGVHVLYTDGKVTLEDVVPHE